MTAEQAVLPADLAGRTVWARVRVHPRHAAAAAITALAAVLNLAGLSSEGYANTYYAAAVKSMLQSWYNFFFVSFDPGGFVGVDKPPLGLWLQTVSARVLGYSGLSMLLPQALAGIACVWLLYVLVSRAFGAPAGLLAALGLALTPIAVVDSRNNTSDSVLVLCLLLAAWAVMRAVDSGKNGSRTALPWLLLGAAFVGVGFNVKELEAYLALPALFLVYLVGAHMHWFTRIWHLLLASLVTLVVSFAWIIAVDLTPASQRPYVSDSGSNSELSLALGYNGLGRLASGLASHLSNLPFLHVRLDFSIVPAVSFEIGNPGITRLIEPLVGGQASWLLPPALIGLVAVAVQSRRLWSSALSWPEVLGLLFWGGWLITLVVFFSVARFYHLYYLNILGPAAAALAGIGAVALWRDYRAGLANGRWWQGWGLPLALAVTAIIQAHILSGYSIWNPWLGPVLIATGVAIAAVLIAGRLHIQLLLSPEILIRLQTRTLIGAALVGAAAALAAPAAFAAVSVANGNGAGWLVQAGPTADSRGFSGGFGGFHQFHFGAGGPPAFSGSPPHRNTTPPGQFGSGRRFGRGAFGGGFGGGGGALTFAGAQIPTIDRGLLRYLQAHRGHSRYLLGTMTSGWAALFIIDTGQAVMTLGGYQGWDRIVTPTRLASLVRNGTIRFFVISPTGDTGIGGFGGNLPAGVNANVDTVNNDLSAWITAHCRTVPASTYSTSPAVGAASGFGFSFRDQGPGTLYDCTR